ncbi:MAG: hypothetical protein U1F52_22625 [Burkholderiales bacterium]
MSSQSLPSMSGRTLVFRVESVRMLEHTDARLRVRMAALVAELHGLERRLAQASEEGTELSEPDIDFSTSAQRFSEVLKSMRVDLYRQAERRAEDFRVNTGADWQVAHLRYGEPDESRLPGRTGKGAVRSPVLDPEEGGAAVSAERVSLFAEVTLGAQTPGAA